MTIPLLAATLVVALFLPSPPPQAAPPHAGPRLVVVIAVDQLRPDYLERWGSRLTGGLGRLLAQGAVFTDAYQDHAVTETAPGHATILSGRWPAHTGIISNDFGVSDRSAPLIGVDGPGASPHRFAGSAFFDWLRAADRGARALSVSRKDRGAILLVGRAKQQVYWYADGQFTTSSYYADELPRWVRAFNDRGIPQRYAARPWTRLLPDSAYATPDSQPWEDPQGSYREKSFPHAWSPDSGESARRFAARPEMDSLTLAFALAGTRALALGRRERATDLLAVSLSTLDAVGHTFGPSSVEVQDMVFRLDRYLGWFFDRLFQEVRPADLVIALTGDHGVTPYPAEARAAGHEQAGAVRVDSLIAAVNAGGGVAGAGATGPAGQPAALFFDSGMLLLEGAEEAGAASPRVDSIVGDLAARLLALPCVARADRPGALAAADTSRDAIARRWLHNLPARSAVVLVVTLRPFCVWGDESYAMHGQPSDLDARVPLILWGRGVRPGTYGGRVATVDLAPTLARLAGATPAEPLDGRVLAEAVKD